MRNLFILRPTLSYAQKLFVLATLPLLLAVAAICLLIAIQARHASEQEIAAIEQQLIQAKQQELQNYLQLARASISATYNPAGPYDALAKLKVSQTLAAMTFGQDGYFFVYDYDGTNLVAPRQTDLIQQNWLGYTDTEGTPIVAPLIEKAKNGGGYHSYLWQKPSTGQDARMMAYVIGLQDWEWAIGTGVFLDDVLNSVAVARADVESRVRKTFFYIGAIALTAVLLVFFSGLFITIRERRMADAKLKALTKRVFDTQEEERSRVARELHDGISQILIGARYAFDLANKRFQTQDPKAPDSLNKGLDIIGGAIGEVRRISRDLRPALLDDLGLGPALKALTEEFQVRTGIAVKLKTVVFRNRLSEDAKIAMFRIAQEALTNIERHAQASEVTVTLGGHRNGAKLKISDNGRGFDANLKDKSGLGLRNMAERMEYLGGTFTITSAPHSLSQLPSGQVTSGTTVDVDVPLKHILPPEKSSPLRPQSGHL